MKTAFPTRFLRFPVSVEGRSAAFFLACEEFVAQELPADDYAFFWQLKPTCVFGRNQDPYAELNIPFCRANGIELMRRKSGGGAIFADRDNIMVSLITGEGSVEDIFADFARTVADGLRTLGVPTRVSGRNDITLDDGRKVCGGAFYHLPARNIVHCTMLYDTDQRLMGGALTPDRAKLSSKGVRSVNSRVGLLKEFLPGGVDMLRSELRSILCDRELLLTPEQVRRIEQLERPYHDEAYIFGAHSHGAHTQAQRLEGIGSISLRTWLTAGRIDRVLLSGDFFETGLADASAAFTAALQGTEATPEAMHAALLKHQPHRSVRGLTAEAAEKLLLDAISKKSQI